jgi:hypothetical protein
MRLGRHAGFAPFAIALMLGAAALTFPGSPGAAGTDAEAPTPYGGPTPTGTNGPVIADLKISRGHGKPHIGNDIYNTTGANQTIAKKASPGDTKQFKVRLTNDGAPGPNIFLGSGSAEESCIRVRYFPAGYGDFTMIIVRGGMGFLDAPVPPGVNPTVIQVEVQNCALAGFSHDATLDIGPSQGIPFDRVIARVNVV